MMVAANITPALPSSRSELRTLMRKCEQMEGMSVLEHGISVAKHYRDLLSHLQTGSSLKYEWKLPDWVYDPLILKSLLPTNDVLTYLVYHDCGKPLCLYFDNEGRRHFPDHANVSYELWQGIFDDSDVAWLIKNDMEIHLARASDSERIANRKYWATQLLAGLAEVHSNSSMFGGTESTSFKIKHKNLSKMGKRILSLKKD